MKKTIILSLFLLLPILSLPATGADNLLIRLTGSRCGVHISISRSNRIIWLNDDHGQQILSDQFGPILTKKLVKEVKPRIKATELTPNMFIEYNRFMDIATRERCMIKYKLQKILLITVSDLEARYRWKPKTNTKIGVTFHCNLTYAVFTKGRQEPLYTGVHSANFEETFPPVKERFEYTDQGSIDTIYLVIKIALLNSHLSKK